MAWYEDEDRGRTHPRAASGRGSIEPKEDHRQTQRSTNFRGNSEKLRARCAESRLKLRRFLISALQFGQE